MVTSLEVNAAHEKSEMGEVKEKYSTGCIHFGIASWSWNQNGYSSAEQGCSSRDGGGPVGAGGRNQIIV